MTPNERFLEAYRNLDTELKANGTTVLDFENSLKDGIDKEKLKICRNMRNYMSHNDVNFLCATLEQSKFIDKLTESIRKASHTVKDEMKRVKTVKPTEPLKNSIAGLDKYPIVPIETKTGIYLVDKDILIHQMAQGNKKIVVPARIPSYKYLNKMDRVDKLGAGIYIVTDNGLVNGKYLGIVII